MLSDSNLKSTEAVRPVGCLFPCSLCRPDPRSSPELPGAPRARQLQSPPASACQPFSTSAGEPHWVPAAITCGISACHLNCFSANSKVVSILKSLVSCQLVGLCRSVCLSRWAKTSTETSSCSGPVRRTALDLISCKISVMAVRLKKLVLMEVSEAFLATKVVRGRICYCIKNTDAIK